MVTWPMTLHDPQRCCETVRSAILATAWLLVFDLCIVHTDFRYSFIGKFSMKCSHINVSEKQFYLITVLAQSFLKMFAMNPERLKFGWTVKRRRARRAELNWLGISGVSWNSGPLGKNARTALQGPLPHSTLSLPLLLFCDFVPRPFSPPSPPSLLQF